MQPTNPQLEESSNPQQKTTSLENEFDEEHFIGHYEAAPGFMKDNDKITHGYRINFNTPSKILRSLFMVHNESVNIWSHCVPAIGILMLLLSFLFFIDREAIPNALQQAQDHLKTGADHYRHAIDNLSLLIDYHAISQRTQTELQELQQTVLENYQEFSARFQASSVELTKLFETEVEGLRSQIHDTLDINMRQFERAKLQFERTLAPMLLKELNQQFDNSWLAELKNGAEKLKIQFDSASYSYLDLKGGPNPQQISRWPMIVFLSSAVICLVSSALFHLFYPMSSKTYTLTNRFDYAGINLLIAGSTFPPLYYGMYCQLAVATLYLTINMIIATVCFMVCLFEWIHRPGHENYKAFMFAGFGLSQLIPVSHMLINEWVFDNYGDPFEFTPSVPYFCLLGISYLGGLYIYTIRCPQRNHPGKYNICGHSHQIWHGMVVLGILFTYLGALQNLEMRKMSVCPA